MRAVSLMLVGLACCLLAQTALAHCQVPCGIYGDQRQFARLEEDIKTIEKGMMKIAELSKDTSKNMNQLVRWVNNKDTHANAIMTTCLNYFLAQRIKVPKKKDPKTLAAYHGKLALVHQIIFYAMKCKQTTDQAHVKMLRDLLKSFHVAYFTKADIKKLRKAENDRKIREALRKKHKG